MKVDKKIITFAMIFFKGAITFTPQEIYAGNEEIISCKTYKNGTLECSNGKSYLEVADKVLSSHKKELVNFLEKTHNGKHNDLISRLIDDKDFQESVKKGISEIIEYNLNKQSKEGGLFEVVDDDEAREIIREAIFKSSSFRGIDTPVPVRPYTN